MIAVPYSALEIATHLTQYSGQRIALMVRNGQSRARSGERAASLASGWPCWNGGGQTAIHGHLMGARTSARVAGRLDIGELVRVAMQLEQRTMQLYCRFEVLFPSPSAVKDFWLDMAEHESRHVGALALVAGLLEYDAQREMPPVPSAASMHVARLRRLIERAEGEAAGGLSLTRAFAIALEIESSEVEGLVLDLLQLLRGTRERERAALSLIHDLSDLSLMIERYGDDAKLLARADRVVERELKRHGATARLGAPSPRRKTSPAVGSGSQP